MAPRAQARVLGGAADFGRALRADLADAKCLSIAVAFAKESALGAVDIESWTRGGRSLNLLAGTDFAITELDLLKRFRGVPLADCRIYPSLGRTRVFHPKLYILDKGASRVVYVGSSNLTRGGLAENIEANVRLEGSASTPEVVEATNLFTSLFDAEYAMKVTDAFDQQYTELQRRLRATQAYPTMANHAVRMQIAESLLLGAYRAQESNTRWLLVTKPENFAACARAGVWGRQTKAEISQYVRKDVFFFHVTGGRGVAAFGMFMGEPYYDETPLWAPDPRGRGNYPWRIRVFLFQTLNGGIPTKEVLAPLHPAEKTHWINGFVAKSHTLESRDFEALRSVFDAAVRAERSSERDA